MGTEKTHGTKFKPNPMYGIPQSVVSYFFQNWGQTLQKRVDVLNEAINLAGFKDTKAVVHGKDFAVNGPEESQELFKLFYQELKACFPLGKFEEEEEAVRGVINKYQVLNI